ncbi:uncharacterized protein LOC126908064 isoform X2 [Daktulosphaira vitifoliae]|uniref:uncharacterized protein LOC126908064 isoform X2 n=1 Tax=Daktulosphaira vitifoliae TaxID=58002 RepID=UPI0021A9D6D3|nr:uncharacterized protein LOC126908064 isoform X2 [Daktulosphaira vitifoliae]
MNVCTFKILLVLHQKICSAWWCLQHSNFQEIIKNIKIENMDDFNIIKKAKSRYAYWTKNGEIRCCTTDRKTQHKMLYLIPKCWPSNFIKNETTSQVNQTISTAQENKTILD